MCCWQRPCWFFAQWLDILGNEFSIAYFNSHPLNDPKAPPKDCKIIHYHVKLGTKTVATSTQNLYFNDGYQRGFPFKISFFI